MKILSIHHCSFLISDLNRSLKFYEEILGLAKNERRPDLGYPGAWLDIGEQQLHLMQLPNPDLNTERPSHGGRDRHVALSIDSLSPLRKALDSAAIRYTLSRSGRKALFCRDPDGNVLEFIER